MGNADRHQAQEQHGQVLDFGEGAPLQFGKVRRRDDDQLVLEQKQAERIDAEEKIIRGGVALGVL